MNIFITGLCFQNNKGGPAIAISLMGQLSKIFHDAKFTFSVPGEAFSESYEREIYWATHYGVSVVENFSHIDFRRYLVNSDSDRGRVVSTWLMTLKKSSLVVDMTAISYVGPPLGRTKRIILDGRFRYFFLSKINKIPFLAWTQSYGPFSNSIIRFLAKTDLKNLPIIFCRGPSCEASVKKLLPSCKTKSYPDVAITLCYDPLEALSYIPMHQKNQKRLVTISPSAVLYDQSPVDKEANDHIKFLTTVISGLHEMGFQILLVPHLFSTTSNSPRLCDYAVCKELQTESLKLGVPIDTIEEDLSAECLKSIISHAFTHIGARYHSLIAALSCAVPSIALSWHPKYQDIMTLYQVPEFTIECAHTGSGEIALDLFNKICANEKPIRKLLMEKHRELCLLIEENTRLLLESYNQIS